MSPLTSVCPHVELTPNSKTTPSLLTLPNPKNISQMSFPNPQDSWCDLIGLLQSCGDSIDGERTFPKTWVILHWLWSNCHPRDSSGF